MISLSPACVETDRDARVWLKAAGLLAGGGISFLILLALAAAQNVTADGPAPGFEDLRTVVFPPPPPPPRPVVAVSPQPPAELVLPPSGAPESDNIRVAMAQPQPLIRPDVPLAFDLSPDAFRVESKGQGEAGYVYEPAEVDQQAHPIRQVSPNINLQLLEKAKHNRVILLFMVDVNGRPQNLRVLQSIQPEVDNAVIEAVSKWLFSPASKDGHPVSQWVKLPVIVNQRESSPFSL